MRENRNLWRIAKILIASVLSIICALMVPLNCARAADVSDYLSFVYLSDYDVELDIGEELQLFAVTSTLKKTKWSSSSSKVASVNAQGVVTAKSAGTAKIYAKIKNADASCKVTVRKTEINLVEKSVQLERGEQFKIRWSTSNGHVPTFKSNKSSVATVDDKGVVTAYKPGEAVVTLKVDGSTKSFKVIVKQPVVSLNKSEISLYRGQQFKLNASVSSKAQVVWKSKKSSVAIVDEKGTVTAVKHGTAIISATVDGVSRLCTVTVMKPEIKLSKSDMTLKVGESAFISATVSSRDEVEWAVSNDRILGIDSKGKVTAFAKGKAYIYAKCDGTKEKCIVRVE